MKSRLWPLCLLFLSACVLPIRSEDIPGVIEKLSESNSSACVRTGAQGGGGAVAAGAGPTVPAGGYGSAELVFCRSNEPGSELEVKPDGTIAIKHGTGLVESLKEQIQLYEKSFEALLRRFRQSPPAKQSGWPIHSEGCGETGCL